MMMTRRPGLRRAGFPRVHPHVLLQVAGREGLAANVAHGRLEVGRTGVVHLVDLQRGCSVVL